MALSLFGTASAAEPAPKAAIKTIAQLNKVNLKFKITRLDSVPKIVGLKLDAPLETMPLKGSFKPVSLDTRLICTYKAEGRSQTPEIKPDPLGRFSISIPIPAQEAPFFFELQAIDGRGKVTTERYMAEKSEAVITAQSRPVRIWSLSTALGFTHLAYTETRFQTYSAILPTPKLAVTYALSPQWSLGASAFMNLASLASSTPSVSVRFVGVNARAGYAFATASPTWKTTAMLGVYSLSMSTTNNALGFDRLTGPQLVLAERKTLDSKNALAGYVKYAPLFDGSSISLTKRELASGVSYERQIGARSFTASFDASLFDFNVGLIKIQSRSLTLGVGLGW